MLTEFCTDMNTKAKTSYCALTTECGEKSKCGIPDSHALLDVSRRHTVAQAHYKLRKPAVS